MRLLLALLLLVPALGGAQAERFFQPTEGFTRAKDLPEDFSAVIRSVQLAVKDVMEGSKVHSDAEAFTYDIINKLHIESRQGTIRRRLIFHEGDTVSKILILEMENALRAEQFLADAIIEVKKWEDGSAHLIVTTYDQWTTTLAFTPTFVGGEFFYNAGVVESNVLGTGQRLGLFRSHARERDFNMIDYGNNAITPWRLRLNSHFAWLSDGYSTLFSLSKPLESWQSRHAFSISMSAQQLTEYVYFDANRLDGLPDSLQRYFTGGNVPIARFDRVATHEASGSLTFSRGRYVKFNMSPSVDWKERYNHGDIGVSRYMNLVNPDPTARLPEERYDLLAGLSLVTYHADYKTVHNFRNLKWSETLETGWRLSTKFAVNQEWLGARNADFYLSHGAVYNNAWWDAIFLNTNGGLKYFVSPGGDFDNGYGNLGGELQWKPVPALSTSLSASFGSYFAAEATHQALLGEETGLNGYPNAYYAGQAFLLFDAEQRWFPPLEFGTLVPALALFGNAGNTYPHFDDVDAGDLHYSVGLGLRLGLTKTVQKLVYHLNLSLPVDEERLDGPTFSFRVKQNL